ncbi:MAG: GNAT family N-acetyltransferase [Parcubacteria group bacterium]|nr:GNAT family N-acetyltransferase [Parcubacteria group bacterium]
MKKVSQYVEFEKDVLDNDISFINKLLRQLNPKAPPITKQIMVNMLKDDSRAVIAVFRNANKNNQIFGMASLHIIPTLFGLKGIIENVVIDKEYRGQGFGKRLVAGLIDAAKKKGVQKIELTSHPDRERANIIYRSFGFKKRKTEVYRLELK